MTDLDPEQILELEFDYARETAAQAQNDRTVIVNLYLLLVGGVGSLVIGLPSLAGAREFTPSPPVYAVLFGLLALIGFFTIMKLVRLRQAWYESVAAMNQIKKFYLEKFPELQPAFLWKPETIPPKGKLWTITFNLTLLVALVDSVAMAASVHFVGIRTTLGEDVPAVIAALLFLAWQLWWYFFQLGLPGGEEITKNGGRLKPPALSGEKSA